MIYVQVLPLDFYEGWFKHFGKFLKYIIKWKL